MAAQSPGTQQPAGTLVLTLDKALDLAREQNRDVLIADQDRYKAGAQVAEARSGALPQISFSGSYTRNIQKPVLFLPPNSVINPTNTTAKFEIGSDNSYGAGASLSQTLYDRRVGVALQIANTYEEFTEEGYQSTAQEVTLQVKKAFYGVLLTDQLVKANAEGLQVVKANLENVRAQYKHGTAAEFDLLRAEVELANTEPLLISAENDLLLAKNALKNLLALPLEQDIRVEGEFVYKEVPAETREQARKEALTKNPAIQQLSLQESMQEMNISIQNAAYFPSLNLFGSYQWQTQDNTFHFKQYNWAQSLSVGLQIQFPLFDGLRTSALAEQATVAYKQVQLMRIKAEEGLRIQIQSAEMNMEEAMKRIQGQEKSIDQAQKAVRIAQTRFQSGVGTQLELLDTQVAMTRTRTNYAKAVYDFLVARAEWDRAVGSGQ
ncbi:MAG: TolC family protein [Bacteroidota bacterium]